MQLNAEVLLSFPMSAWSSHSLITRGAANGCNAASYRTSNMGDASFLVNDLYWLRVCSQSKILTHGAHTCNFRPQVCLVFSSKWARRGTQQIHRLRYVDHCLYSSFELLLTPLKESAEYPAAWKIRLCSSRWSLTHCVYQSRGSSCRRKNRACVLNLWPLIKLAFPSRPLNAEWRRAATQCIEGDSQIYLRGCGAFARLRSGVDDSCKLRPYRRSLRM